MGHVTITHTPAEGTLAGGDTREYKDVLKSHGWRWSSNLGSWFIPNSRDRLPRDFKIADTVTALERAGATVTTEIERVATPTAEKEANKADRLGARQDALSAKAERLEGESNAAYERSRTIADRIPFGQPILVGHHSERGHRADIAKIHRAMDTAITTGRAAWMHTIPR